jgi:EmrB/QacA subfamily drug resistance transporter
MPGTHSSLQQGDAPPAIHGHALGIQRWAKVDPVAMTGCFVPTARHAPAHLPLDGTGRAQGSGEAGSMIATAAAESRSRIAVLVAAIVASSMSYIDITALSVALPIIKAKLPANDAQAQWVAEGYLLFLSALILIGGALGDRYGRRRLFVLGIWIFALSSIGCAIATLPGLLIAARCVQGVGAALMIPESLALITATFDARSRGRAIGIWAATSAIMMTAGPVLGGWLTQSFSWRLVFWINIPLAVVALFLAYRGVPESRAENASGKPDLLGSALITVALALIVAALMQMQRGTANPNSFPLFIAGLALLGAFVFVERRSSAPVVPLRLFESRRFTIASVYTFLLYAALGGELFLVPFQLQHIMRYSPLATGLALMPTIALIAAGSPISGAFAARAGERLPLIAGAAIAAVGIGLFVRLGFGAPYGSSVLPATIVLGIGIALAVPPLLTTVMGAADSDDVGAASGINNAISRVGNVVAIAVLGVVISTSGGGALPTSSHPEGFRHAMLGAAAMSLIAALVAVFLPARPTLAP